MNTWTRVTVLCLALCGGHAHAQSPREVDFESIVQQAYTADAPGAAVIVVREGRVLYRGARGMANLELDVPLQPDNVFRVGSITKQFTAAAILLLADEGRLSLSDPITRFLPDYPLQGNAVTLSHLLSHTSGIANYTEIPEWQVTTRNDVSVPQLMAMFRDKPFDFTPGAHWKYDNSGYILLGAVIEKLSGQKFGDFLRTRIFDPLGMTNTRYEDVSRIIPRRVPGYMRDDAGWRNADYLSMSQPYAAGAVISNVDDLARWNAAIDSGQLLKPASWQRAQQSFVLADGTPTRYGAGWILGRVGPVATVEHGGGINGFNAYVLRAPDRHVYVAVLANASPPPTPPQEVAVKLAALALGVSLDAPEVPLAPVRLDEYAGTYLLAEGRTRVIARDHDRLRVRDGDAATLELTPTGRDLFEARANQSRFRFRRERGRIVAVDMEPRILMGDRARRADSAR